MNRIRAAWSAFKNPDVLNVVVSPDTATTQAALTVGQANAIIIALQKVRRQQGRPPGCA